MEPLPQTIPVLDLSRGRAVRAVRGRRNEYRPLESVLAPGSDPRDLALALVEDCGFAELYAADLDAIQTGRRQFDLLERLLALPVRWLLDLGLRGPHDLQEAERRLVGARVVYVVATETCYGASELRSLVSAAGSRERLALGLDFLRGRFRTRDGLAGQKLEAWIDAALHEGVGSVVALDLDRVGSDRGFAWPGELESSAAFSRFERRISGGGIRSIDDLKAARAAGCDAVLVGSALHDGRLSPADLATT